MLQSERKLTSSRRAAAPSLVRAPDLRPGFYTGYGVKTIPGVREAIEQKHWKEADEQIVLAANALQQEAAFIDSIAQQLERPSSPAFCDSRVGRTLLSAAVGVDFEVCFQQNNGKSKPNPKSGGQECPPHTELPRKTCSLF